MKELPKHHKHLLFVCSGNICRSPALAAVMKKLAREKGLNIYVDSCAATAWFLGCKADPRMCEAAKKWGVEIDTVAKLFDARFFVLFDEIFVVDESIEECIRSYAMNEQELAKIKLATCYAKECHNQEIPDPYYEGKAAFDDVMRVAFEACQGILIHLLS